MVSAAGGQSKENKEEGRPQKGMEKYWPVSSAADILKTNYRRTEKPAYTKDRSQDAGLQLKAIQWLVSKSS